MFWKRRSIEAAPALETQESPESFDLEVFETKLTALLANWKKEWPEKGRWERRDSNVYQEIKKFCITELKKAIRTNMLPEASEKIHSSVGKLMDIERDKGMRAQSVVLDLLDPHPHEELERAEDLEQED